MTTSAAVSAAPFPRAGRPVLHYRAGAFEAARLPVVCEVQVRVVVSGRPLATLLCSATALRELAYGFLYNEGVVDGAGEVLSCACDPGAGEVRLAVVREVEPPASPVRPTGLGGAALAAWGAPGAGTPVPSSPTGDRASLAAPSPAAMAAVLEAVRRMQAAATEYAATRGMHCSALLADGALLAHYEDVGRHNTLDKLAGFCLLSGVDPHGCTLATTGRVSGEMMRKAQRLGCSAVASLSGPTVAAVDLARAGGTLLAGYVRDGGATVYAPGGPAPRDRAARGNLKLVQAAP